MYYVDRKLADYELSCYFYRNYFLSRNFNSVTNNTNNSYDILDRNKHVLYVPLLSWAYVTEALATAIPGLSVS